VAARYRVCRGQPRTGFRSGARPAAGPAPVSANPDFLCGTELSTIDDETLFFAQRGLSIDAVAVEVRLQPGELLLFDNLAVAHGRRESRARRTALKSVRAPALDPGEQIKLRDRMLAAFTG